MDKDILNKLVEASNYRALYDRTDYYIYNKSTPKKQDFKPEFTQIRPFTSNSYFRDYIVLDFITTGYCVNNNNILLIHALKIINNKIVDEYYSLVNNNSSLPAHILKKHCLDVNKIKSSPFISTIREDFLKFIDNGKLTIVIKDNYNKIDFLLFNFNNNNLFKILDIAPLIKENKIICNQNKGRQSIGSNSTKNKILKNNYNTYYSYEMYKSL